MSTRSTGSIFNPGLILQSRYRLDEVVASGGMAEVWRGHDMILQRNVAIKLLHPHLATDSSLAERFKREAISAARLSHPNIVPTFDTGNDRGVFYIVMGLVSGPTLSDVLRDHLLTQEQVAEIGRQIADALEAAHKNGVVHRDIKPSNVLIVDSGTRVMVADFGIAKAIAETVSDATLPGLTVGTPDYMAPEQIDGSNSGAKIDIYALGVLMHEALCGHTGNDQPTAITSVDELKKTVGTEKCPEIPEPIRQVILKATAINPDDRFETAGKMRDELVRVELLLHETNRELEPFSQELPPATPQVRPEIQGQLSGSTTQQSAVSPFKGRYDPIPAQKAAGRRTLTTSVVLMALILIAVAFGLGIKSLAHSIHAPTTAHHTASAPITISGATSFDPYGSDHVENEAQADKAVDGNPNTGWSTETYTNSHFGNLKPGVGLILHVNDGAKMNQLQINSSSSGWSASIYVANNSPTSLNGWGNQIAGQQNIVTGATTFQLNGATGNSVLIWITDLGSANRVTLNEITIKS